MLHRHLFRTRAICAPAAMTAMFVISGAAHGGGIRYVDDDAPPGGDGTSWNTAYRFLQDGLTDACGGGIAEIRVGQGTYKPDRDEANPGGTGDREATFQLCNGVALMGGYAGFGAKNPDDRDTELYETILSGDLLDNDGPDFENNDENSYHVVTHTGTDNTAVLEATTITAGNANGSFPQNFGGGVFDNPGSATLTGCTLRGNSAASGGGGMFNFGSATLTNCTFIDNISAFSGGGMHSVGGLTLTTCTFTQNSAIVRGGGMYIEFSNPMLANCTFKGNLAGSEGGGIWIIGGNPTLTNCMLSGNIAATNGGGMFNDNASPTLTNCTFSGNNAGINGGGMYNTVSSPEVTNGILWGNSPDQIFNFGANPTVSYSDVEGGYAGAGNIDADPLFVDDAAGDLHLSAGSPCIDAADNTAVPKGIDTDLDGNPRFVDDPCIDDTGNGDPPILDMGAYEFQVTCPWDLDCNGSVGVKDLLFLLGAWGPCPPKGDCPADFDGSGDVGVKDLLFLLGAWGPCP